jgi:hypothetical protein
MKKTNPIADKEEFPMHPLLLLPMLMLPDRVFRGGSWSNTASYVRSSNRAGTAAPPQSTTSDPDENEDFGIGYGFRLVRNK